MTAFDSMFRREFCTFCIRFCLLLAVLAGLLTPQVLRAQDPEAEARPATPSRLLSPIDEHALVTLSGNVRADLTKDRDLGAVDDGMTLRLSLVLQRSPAQQADLENLLARQQQSTAAEYHKWLTPKAFGARFGASSDDLAKLSGWLESHGLKIRSVLNNASIIDFEATAGQVRDTFHTQLHYFNIQGGKYAANVQDPQIPAALAPVIAGIHGLDRIPPVAHHTKARQAAYDTQSHRWHDVQPDTGTARPEYFGGPASYNVAPQDLYAIYNVNPVFTGGELASHATVAVIEESDIQYGTVNATTGVASGGDVATFRSIFGVQGTLNMHVYHGYGSVTCNDPGVDPDGSGEDIEASLDAEWANATAPSANLIFMSCDQSPDNGIFTSLEALVDNNMADVMSMSYGSSELNFTGANSGFYAYQDTFYAQAASQGQSIFISSGDSGSDTADQNTPGLATSGINVSAFLSPLVTATGGTDFSDEYDFIRATIPQETYWADSNSAYYGDALGYVPETSWNGSCISSLFIAVEGETGLGLCDEIPSIFPYPYNTNDGTVVGGGGGISTHYTVPSYQLGISGYSGAYHSIPDISGFASNGFWGHALLFCDSNSNYGGGYDCSSSGAFGEAGGTSFVAPYMAGVGGLLVDYTGARQGVLNPTLYALAKAQYTAAGTATACYSNGQTTNTGVTTGLPGTSCIFNDITTGNNDEVCSPGSTDCYSGTDPNYGGLSLDGSSSLVIAYPSKPGFDQVTGIGSVNVSNLITKWNTAFSSTTAISASATSIGVTQSTILTATVTGGTPAGYVDTPPALTGTASFKAGTTVLGSCTLSGRTCSVTVAATALAMGANSVTATFAGSPTYPSSSSSILTVTVSATETPVITSVSPIVSAQTQTITISGSGFGTQAAYTGNSNYISLSDITGSWSGGKTGDGITLGVSSWTDSQIVLSGIFGNYGTTHCIRPGDSLSISVWNAPAGTGPSTYAIPATGTTDNCPAKITSVSPIVSAQTQTITISGVGFGTQTAYTGGTSPYLQLSDNTGAGWAAGHTGDGITLSVSSWTDSQIVITGLSGSYGTTHCIRPGDSLSVSVWNANTGTGEATYSIPATGTTDNCPAEITSVSPIVSAQTQTITITGVGFGTQSAFTGGTSPYLQLSDNTGTGWAAGHTGDGITLSVSSWTDSQIVITGLSGSYGTTHCIRPGDSLSVSVWNANTGTGEATYAIPATGTTDNCPAKITSVSPIISAQTQTITITGVGFGTQTAYTGGTSPYLQLSDNTGAGWAAGHTGDGITLSVSSWTDSQIVITGLSGSYGTTHCIRPGDSLSVSVWNANTGTGEATYAIPATGTTDNCPAKITSVSTILPQQTQTITITGVGFGSQTAYTGVSPYIQVTDSTRSWSAGYTGEGVTLVVNSWTDSQIVLGGFAGSFGPNHCIAPGDQLSISVWNVNTGTNPAVYTTQASSVTSTCP